MKATVSKEVEETIRGCLTGAGFKVAVHSSERKGVEVEILQEADSIFVLLLVLSALEQFKIGLQRKKAFLFFLDEPRHQASRRPYRQRRSSAPARPHASIARTPYQAGSPAGREWANERQKRSPPASGSNGPSALRLARTS